MKPPDQNKVMTLVTETTTTTFEVEAGDPPEFSDVALAQRFAELHGDELRFISKWSQWYAWEETRWLEESGCFAQTTPTIRDTGHENKKAPIPAISARHRRHVCHM